MEVNTYQSCLSIILHQDIVSVSLTMILFPTLLILTLVITQFLLEQQNNSVFSH